MRGFLIFLLVFFVLEQNPAQAEIGNFIWHPKDYKQMFLNDAYNSEKRNNHKAAFHSYEKAMYYYGKDEKVVASYAAFCERNNYLDRAEHLYLKLYILTKDKKYLFKSNLCAIKNGKLSEEKIEDILKKGNFTQRQLIEFNKAQISHYAYHKKWNQAKRACDRVPIKDLDKNVIANCIFASEKTSDKSDLLKYYTRFHQLNPKDSEILNKAIIAAQNVDNFSAQEIFVKKLLELNPKDKGIKYKLAGVYEKYGQWQKALKVYESLMTSGDLSEHVKSSLGFVREQLDRKEHPQKYLQKTASGKYEPKPLSGYKLSEKLFYDSWRAKDYQQAQKYLSQMLKVSPNNPKLLKHRIDIDFSLENYSQAISDMAELSKMRQLSLEEEKFLAFLYSKEGNNAKALEIIENILKNKTVDETLDKLALEYSMADKNWDRALLYSGRLLENNPKSEELLKTQRDLYSIKSDYSNAALMAKRLVDIAPTYENKMNLANLYMAAKEFEKAQEVLEPIYKKQPDNAQIVNAYLNSLMAQQKLYDSYQVVRDSKLENTFEGYVVQGDLYLKNALYDESAAYYFKALQINPDNADVKNNLAFSYRMMGHIASADKLYKEVLAKNPDNPEAELGLGSLEIDKKNFDCARQIFCKIIKERPSYRPAKIALAHSYIANDEKLHAIEVLESLSQDEESKDMLGQAYYDINMWNDAKTALRGAVSEDAGKLKYKIRRDEAITFTPGYSFMISQLADEFNLDYQKYGIAMAKKTKGNANIFAEYNNIVYSSGATAYLTNVTNEIKAGVQARPNKNWEYRADLGVRAFQFGNGALLTTDSWIKHYFNDKFSLKAGVKRINIEQSYLSAVGQYVDGVFTGRCADNKFYLEYDAKLPKQFYSFGRFAYGLINSQNLTTNQYLEGYVGIGKAVYENPKNEWLQRVSLDLVSYNASWQYNQLKIYNSVGTLFGGYFSPNYFNATTLQVKLEGKIKKLNNLKYGISGFGGIQNAITPDLTTPTWGYSPYISYDINDHVSINASYTHYTFADIQRDYFMVNAVIRGFRKHVKK